MSQSQWLPAGLDSAVATSQVVPEAEAAIFLVVPHPVAVARPASLGSAADVPLAAPCESSVIPYKLSFYIHTHIQYICTATQNHLITNQ